MQPEMRAVDRPVLTTPPQKELRDDTSTWRLGTKIAFRFAFVYLVLWSLYFPLHLAAGILPPFAPIERLYNHFWAVSVPWFAHHVLNLSHNFAIDNIVNATGDSKDTTYIYVEALCYVLVAACSTLVWSILDRRRPNYQRLHNWFSVYLRMCLVSAMVPIGFIKIFPMQFPPPTPSKLLETYGDSSPMGLMWTFMGFSRIYSFFGGISELVSGLLLAVPRLALLGALICIGLMTNVLLMNFGYDVPVKLGSINYILMAAYIVISSLKRLADFFVWNRRAEPASPEPLFRRLLFNRIAIAVQVAFGFLLMLYAWHNNAHRAQAAQQARTDAAPLYGIWTVDQFELDGQVRPPLLTDSDRWQRMVVDSVEQAGLQPMTGPVQHLYLHLNKEANRFELGSYQSSWEAEFNYLNPQPDTLLLMGKIRSQPARITLHREELSNFLLNSRGFHWIQEYAVNK